MSHYYLDRTLSLTVFKVTSTTSSENTQTQSDLLSRVQITRLGSTIINVIPRDRPIVTQSTASYSRQRPSHHGVLVNARHTICACHCDRAIPQVQRGPSRGSNARHYIFVVEVAANKFKTIRCNSPRIGMTCARTRLSDNSLNEDQDSCR